MSNLAIPAAPPTASPGADTASPPATDGKRFDATLRQSQQPASKPRSDGDRADDDVGVPKPEDHETTAGARNDKDPDDTNFPAGLAPMVMAVTAPMPQPVANGGKTLPATRGKSVPATSGNPVLATSGNPVPATSGNPVLATSGNPVPATSGNPVLATSGNPVPAASGNPVPAASGNPVPAATSAAVVLNIATAAPAATKLAAAAPQSDPPSQTSADANLAAALKMPAGDAGAQVVDLKDDVAASHTGADSFIAHMAQLAVMHAGPTPTPTPTPPTQVQLMMQAAPGQPQFIQETAQHVVWLAGQNIQRAEIQLNPKKLGPIQVEITTHQDHVDVNFAVQHPQTVNALQQTLPQLQHMLAQQGLNLGHASVGQQAHGRPHAAPAYHASGNSVSTEPDNRPEPLRVRIATPGRVDDFA
ncbi:MAG TPA: flagellar hook-length control protein FliK [Rhodanobacteraceae bacterium]|nr:flagellar hook-length control protein FliK [Rhodanobacteraceae bacterium]